MASPGFRACHPTVGNVRRGTAGRRRTLESTRLQSSMGISGRMAGNDLRSGHAPRVDEFVRSSDGTRVGFTRLGSGPALVVVHGSLSTREDWLTVASLLADHFTCYVMDRRGRGLSGDAPDYAIERECDDITAVLVAAGRAANLLAHSFGAICALETAMRVVVPHLILYEPPLPVGGRVAGEHLGEYRAAVATGRLDEALEIGLTRFVGLSAGQIAGMRTAPIWPQLRSRTPTWTREVEAIDGLSSSVDRYSALTSSTLLLVGSESAKHLRDATAALSQVLQHGHVTTLVGQGHMAGRLAPELVARAVTAFLRQ